MSARTAAMKSSVTSTDRLKLRSRPGSDLASMKASISGWSQRSVAIMAPRRLPADMMVRHMASHTSMKLTGPDASAPMRVTRAPLGRRVEKSWPMPPPCCMVSAASLTLSKMALRSSSMRPRTKQLKRVTERPVPAPARMRPGGQEAKIGNGVVEALGPLLAGASCPPSQPMRRRGRRARTCRRETNRSRARLSPLGGI